MNFYVGDDMKIADAAMVRNGASHVSRRRPRIRRLLKMRAISRRSREIERGADAVRDLAGNSLEFTGVDLLNTKFQLFNFKYQEVGSDPPHSQRWPWTYLLPRTVSMILLSSSQVITEATTPPDPEDLDKAMKLIGQ